MSFGNSKCFLLKELDMDVRTVLVLVVTLFELCEKVFHVQWDFDNTKIVPLKTRVCLQIQLLFKTESKKLFQMRL